MKDRAKAVADARAALIQLVLAIGGAGTLYFTWKNYERAAGEFRETRTSDNFVKAAEQLGSESIAVRAGGIFGIGRMLRAAEPERDYWPMMDVLTAFVRHRVPIQKYPRAEKPPEDVQAALNVLARRTHQTIPERSEDSPVDLHHTDLSEAWMAGGHFEWAFFERCQFMGADLSDAKLRKALFFHAQLEQAILCRADLTEASFYGANLSGADLRGATLHGTDFSDADLQRAKLDQDQLHSAIGNRRTTLPDTVAPPSSWT